MFNNMKYSIVLVLFLSSIVTVNGQEVSSQKQVESYFQLNTLYSAYQDSKFSNVKYNGIGQGFHIGRIREKGDKFIQYGFKFSLSRSRPSTFKVDKTIFGNAGSAREIQPRLYFKYLKKLNEKWHLGGKVDLLDSYFRVSSGLGNNKISYLIGSNIFASARYSKEINEDFKLNFNIGLGVLSYMRESTGFAFSTPQDVTANGEFNYQDENVLSPFGFKYYKLRPLWNFGNINLVTEVKYKKRWAFVYEWRLRRFSTLKKYPTTIAVHHLGLKYNFVSRLKSGK